MHSFLAEVPAEAPGLAALIEFLIAFGLVYVAVPLVRLLLGGPGSIIGRIPIIGAALKAPIKAIEDRTVKWLSNRAAALQANGVMMLRLTWHLNRWFIDQLYGVAVDTYHGLHGLDASLKRFVAQHTGRVQATVPATKAGAKANTVASVALQRRWIRARLRDLRDYVDASIAAAIAAVGTRPLEIALGRLRDVLGKIAGLRARVGKLDKILTAVGAAALVGVGLRKLGLGWLRCTNTKAVGKAVCGAPRNLINALVTNAFDALVVADLCQFVALTERAAEAFEPVLKALVGVTDYVCTFGGATLPSAVEDEVPRRDVWLPSGL